MTSTEGPLTRLDSSREELAKAWLLRLIERASLDEIKDLPTDRMARELPELITDIVTAVRQPNGAPFVLSDEQLGRASALAALRGGADSSPGEIARDVAALQAVLVRALREELGDADPGAFADAVERLAEASGAVQAAAIDELVKVRSRELETQANTDPLTGLFNLRHLQRAIGQLLDLQKRYEHPFAVLLLDVDGLKRINDGQGHAAGDRVLLQVSMSLRRSVRTVDVPARIGGDEFCVLAPEQDTAGAMRLAERLAAAAREETALPDAPVVGVSIGVAACPEHADEADALIDLADRAMYRAKAAGEGVAIAEARSATVAEQAKR